MTALRLEANSSSFLTSRSLIMAGSNYAARVSLLVIDHTRSIPRLKVRTTILAQNTHTPELAQGDPNQKK